MLKADLGDILYIVIFAVLMLAGALEKVVKAKRQQQNTPPPPPYDDFEDVEEPSSQQTPPQTLEEMLRRMMQTAETQEQIGENIYPEEAQSLEVIPETPAISYYQSAVSQITNQPGIDTFTPAPIDENNEAAELQEYEFDIRQAVIASEILNRKY